MIDERPDAVAVAGGITLEAAVAVPPGATAGVVVCHPHPLYGGDMHNPVVVRTAEVCVEAGLAALRFNFRGVGASTGAHDDGKGEQDDVRAARARLAALLAPPARVALAGYSFGAAMVAAAAARDAAPAGLALIAPPLAMEGRVPAQALRQPGGPLLVVAGTDDEYCPAEALGRLEAALPPGVVARVEGANHFFLGKLHPMGEAVRRWAVAVAAG
jgi:hypothetical protein